MTKDEQNTIKSQKPEGLAQSARVGSLGDGKITMDDASPIQSNAPDIGGWSVTNKLLGKTPGERMFNLLDWYGVGYLANSAISIWSSDQAGQGFLWPAFKRFNHFLGNTRLFRDRPEKFGRLEAEYLDSFIDQVRAFATQNNEKGQKVLGSLADSLIAKKMLLPDEKVGFINAVDAEQWRNIRRKTGINDLLGSMKGSHREFETFLKTNKNDHLWDFAKESLAKKGTLKPSSGDIFEHLSENAKKLKNSRTNARSWTGFLMLSTGGFALMLPIKWLEDKKSQIVKYFDDRYEKKHHLTDAQKEAIETRHSELEKEPKQSYFSVITARLVSYPTVIGAYLAMGPRNTLHDPHADHKGSSWIGRMWKGWKGTDHWFGTGAQKIYDATKHTAPMKAMVQKLEKGVTEREQYYRHSQEQKPHRALLSRFSSKGGEKRMVNIISDTITESAYSLWMVTATFIASRFTAALGIKKQESPAPRSPKAVPQSPVTPQEAASSAAKDAPVAERDLQTPSTRVTPDALSSWMSKSTNASERLSSGSALEPARA